MIKEKHIQLIAIIVIISVIFILVFKYNRNKNIIINDLEITVGETIEKRNVNHSPKVFYSYSVKNKTYKGRFDFISEKVKVPNGY